MSKLVCKAFVFACLVSFVPNVAFSQTVPQGKGQPVPSDSVQRGQAQFAQSCGFCHGPDASGGAEGPDLMRSAVVRHDENGNLIGAVIRDGRPAKGMPPVSLNDAQIAEVVAFLHSRLKASDRRSPGRPQDYDLKLLLTGNAAAGKAFFYGAGECSRCHSPSGDLAGIAKKYPPPDLQARFLYPSDVPKTVVVTTRSGAQFTGELFFRDPFSIAMKDAQGWYHSWPCADVQFQIHDPLAGHLDLLHKYTDSDVHNLFAYLETLK
jgi:cytochrome c oxidase cbb3-type subunit 3